MSVNTCDLCEYFKTCGASRIGLEQCVALTELLLLREEYRSDTERLVRLEKALGRAVILLVKRAQMTIKEAVREII